MRFLKSIPHDTFSIQIFVWNQKYIVKYEYQLLEQTYKIPEFDVLSEQELEIQLTQKDFLENVLKRFEEMNNDWGKLFFEEYEK